jgi:hypothetical protein
MIVVTNVLWRLKDKHCVTSLLAAETEPARVHASLRDLCGGYFSATAPYAADQS